MKDIIKVGLVGIAAWLGWDYLQKRKANEEAAVAVINGAAKENSAIDIAEIEEEGEEGGDAMAVAQASTHGAVYKAWKDSKSWRPSAFTDKRADAHLASLSADGWDSDNLI